MPLRTWAKLVGLAFGVATLTGAGQLGVAYGLGVLRLGSGPAVTTTDQWTAQLAWVVWLAVTAAVAGAVVAGSQVRRNGVGARIVAAVAASVGSAIVVPLTIVPARMTQVSGVQPAFVIGMCAALGALVGGCAAFAALSRPVARWSLVTTGIAVWIVMLGSAGPSLAPGGRWPSVRLGVFDAAFLSPAMAHLTSWFTMPALAAIIGVALGLAARRRKMSTLTVATAGLAGPAQLTLAYLIAGPGADADHYQLTPYWAAMITTGAGVLGSVVVAMLRGRTAGADPGQETTGAGPALGDEPTPGRPPLPKREAQPQSAIATAAAGSGQPADGTGRPEAGAVDPGRPESGAVDPGRPEGGAVEAPRTFWGRQRPARQPRHAASSSAANTSTPFATAPTAAPSPAASPTAAPSPAASPTAARSPEASPTAARSPEETRSPAPSPAGTSSSAATPSTPPFRALAPTRSSATAPPGATPTRSSRAATPPTLSSPAVAPRATPTPIAPLPTAPTPIAPPPTAPPPGTRSTRRQEDVNGM